jgi:hypothetical protein
MNKLTKEQVEEIRHVKEVVSTLQRMQDRIYSQLLDDLGFKAYIEEEKATGDAYSGKEHLNPEKWLFDIVYNLDDVEQFSQEIAKLENKIKQYAAA